MTDGSANEGQDMHDAADTGNVDGLNAEQADQVTKALDYVMTVRATMAKGFQELNETRIELIDRTFGTADKILISCDHTEAHVFDYKFIRTEDKDYDFQVRTYGAGLFEKYPELKMVTTHIVAPRIDVLEVKEYDRSLYDALCKEIDDLYARIDDPFLPPTPHAGLCDRCARASKCPAISGTALTVAKGVGLPVPDAFSPDAIVSLKDRAVAQVLAGALANWSEQVKKQNAAFVKESGQTLPGFKLVTRSTGARIPREASLTAFGILQDNGIMQETVMAACSISIPELAKSVCVSDGTNEDDAKAKLKGLLAEVTVEGKAEFLQKTKRVDDATAIRQITGG